MLPSTPQQAMCSRARATALEKGVDAVLGPLLDKVEQSMRTSLQLEWTSLELEELYSLLKAAAKGEVALEKCGRAVHRLLALMLAIQMTAVASQVGPVPVVTESQSSRARCASPLPRVRSRWRSAGVQCTGCWRSCWPSR